MPTLYGLRCVAMAAMEQAIWPLMGLHGVTPMLTLRYITDDLGMELALLAAEGVHDPDPCRSRPPGPTCRSRNWNATHCASTRATALTQPLSTGISTLPSSSTESPWACVRSKPTHSRPGAVRRLAHGWDDATSAGESDEKCVTPPFT